MKFKKKPAIFLFVFDLQREKFTIKIEDSNIKGMINFVHSSPFSNKLFRIDLGVSLSVIIMMSSNIIIISFQGCVYQMDEWEVPRDLIIKGEELGSGSFGVCHKGIYNYPDKVGFFSNEHFVCYFSFFYAFNFMNICLGSCFCCDKNCSGARHL